MSNPEKFAAAFEAGLNAGRALAIGDIFTGAFGAADSAGYDDESPYRKSFVSGYLYGLEESGKKDSIVVDNAGRVVEFRGR